MTKGTEINTFTERDPYERACKIASMKLPGVPHSERGVIGWAAKPKNNIESREAKGKGGGREYRVRSFPAEARMAYFEQSLSAAEKPAKKDILQLTPRQREIADKRLGIVMEWLHIAPDVPPQKLMISKRKYAKSQNIHYNTLDNLVKAYQSGGYHALVPNWNRGEQEKIITSEMVKFIEKAYLQPLGPPIIKVYEDLCKIFAETCPRLPTYRTVAAFINVKWTKGQQLLLRNKEEWDRLYSPYVRRDWTKVELNEVWFSDHKQIDVACLYRGKVIFPWLTVVEEAKSRKFVGWILVPTPNALAIGQAFLYGVSKYGPPKTLYVDRGKDYKSRYIAGKKEKRNTNGDLVEDRIPGLVAQVGTEVFSATGRNPREKINEPAFGWFTDRCKFHGYRGHSIKTRPKKLAKEIKSGNLLTFEELSQKIDDLINERNARPHSTTGKSPDSYWEGHQAVIPSQQFLNYLLMDVHEATVKDSSVLVKGLLYRGDELFKLAGERVEVRRDPKDIRRAVVIYKDQVFCSATLETPDHYRSEITLQSVQDAARVRKKIKQFRKTVIESEKIIDDPLRLAVELDQKEKVRTRDIRPGASKVRGFNKQEKLARSVAEKLAKSVENQEGAEIDENKDILSRLLAATSGIPRQPRKSFYSSPEDPFDY